MPNANGDDDDHSNQRRYEGGGDLVSGHVERCTNGSRRLVSVELDPAGQEQDDGGERPRQTAVGSKVGSQHRNEIGTGSQILEHGTGPFGREPRERDKGRRRNTVPGGCQPRTSRGSARAEGRAGAWCRQYQPGRTIPRSGTFSELESGSRPVEPCPKRSQDHQLSLLDETQRSRLPEGQRHGR